MFYDDDCDEGCFGTNFTDISEFNSSESMTSSNFHHRKKGKECINTDYAGT